MITYAEKLLPGPDAIEQVTGERPAYSTFLRWTRDGVQVPGGDRIRLEFIKCGSKRKTTVAAVRRFFEATTLAMGAAS